MPLAAGEEPQAGIWATVSTKDGNSLPSPWDTVVLCGAHKPGRPWKSTHWGQDSCWILYHTLVGTVENTCSQSGIMSPAPNPCSPLASSPHGAEILLQTHPLLPES